MNDEVFILEGARTPFGSFGGKLASMTSTKLGTIAATEALQRANVEPNDVDNVVFGNVIYDNKGSAYVSRHIALDSGVPEAAPALTVNRLCGSGLQAVVTATKDILAGESDLSLVGGTEVMSCAPYVIRNARFGLRMGNGIIHDVLAEVLTDCRKDIPMGITAENLANRYSISRGQQDEFALLSQERAFSARDSGIFAQEIVPVVIKGNKGEVTIGEDEHIRPNVTLSDLARLKPVFDKSGTVTAGNSSGINDGAGAFVLASKREVYQNHRKPLARIVSFAVAGVDPAYMGLGPVPAIRLALGRAGLSTSDISIWEINEAFAAQYLSVEREMELPRERTNVNGGAIALGHPIGASGVRLLLTLIYELRRRKERYGLASLCIGGGQGIAMIVEALFE